MVPLAFSFITLPDRPAKPRYNGLTMAIDRGLSAGSAFAVCKNQGNYIDVVKLGWGTSRLCREDEIISKVRMYKQYGIGVMPGGTLLEIACAQNQEDEFLEKTVKYGFTHIEVSCGTFDLGDRKGDLIRCAANMGFTVFAEVGQKAESWEASIQELVASAQADLSSGAAKVILEGRESGTCGIYRKDGSVRTDLVDGLVESVPIDDLIFEAPQKKQQVYFIERFGNSVNLGNIAVDDVLSLETIRVGLRGDTAGKFHGRIECATAEGYAR